MFEGKSLEESPNWEKLYDDRVLQIRNFNNKTVGNYSCVATNEGGSKEISLQLHMTGKNSFVYITSFSFIEFYCIFSF